MPLNRYQIRNEYSLADPELYKVADKDDPEALLEGVAMSGLVGVLRQLGGLAQFAAEIFHDLHEEVMATAARGHGLIIRTQQLEAEFPSIERTLLSQTSHASFLYNSGVEWHPNLRMDQSVVTRGDLPRFVMDSYEECRGPPRLFLLDKFDVAGAGACLKRFTDPSFFKSESTPSTGRNIEGQREKKTRRVKKRGPRVRNGDTPESFPSSHAKLHQLFLEERIESGINDPSRRVKLKKRQFTGSLFEQDNVRSYMEKFLDSSPQEQKILHEICIDPLPLTWKSDNPSESGLEIVDIGTISPVKEPIQADKSLSFEVSEALAKPSLDDVYQDKNLTSYGESRDFSGPNHEIRDESMSIIPVDLNSEEIVERESIADVSGENSDDVASEIDNYMDALANIESEFETDSESKRNAVTHLNLKPIVVDSDGSERQRELRSFSLDSHSVGNSVLSEDGDNFSKERETSSCSDSFTSMSKTTPAPILTNTTIQASNSDSENLYFDHYSTEEIVRKEREKHVAARLVDDEVDDLQNEHILGKVTNKKVTWSDMENGMDEKHDEVRDSDSQSEGSEKFDVILGESNQDPTSQHKLLIVEKEDPDSSLSSDNDFAHLLETNTHNHSASMLVEGNEKNLGMDDVDARSNSESSIRHVLSSDSVHPDKTNSADVAYEEEFCIPSTQESSKDLFCVSDFSASLETNPVRSSSLDFATENLPSSWQDPSMEDMSGSGILPGSSNQLQTPTYEFSTFDNIEATKITEGDSLEADLVFIPSSSDEFSGEISRSVDEKFMTHTVMEEKTSLALDSLETQHELPNIPSKDTDTILDVDQNEVYEQISENDIDTKDTVLNEADIDHAPSHYHGNQNNIFSQDESPLNRLSECSNNSELVMVAENDSDQDHNVENLDNLGTIDDHGPVDFKDDDNHQNAIVRSVSDQELIESPVLVSEDSHQNKEDLIDERIEELTERRQTDPIEDASSSSHEENMNEHAVGTTSLVFHGNGILDGDNRVALEENLENQPLSQQDFPDLEKRPTEPRVSLEPPSLPPLPPMQWRLGRFQNPTTPSMERQQMLMTMPNTHPSFAPIPSMASVPMHHHSLPSFQPVSFQTGNNTLGAIPQATLPTSLPAVHYTFAPLQTVTLPTGDNGTETLPQTFTSDGLFGYSDSYVTQQGVFALPVSMPVGVSDGYFHINTSSVGGQENRLLTVPVPLTSSALNGYVTQQRMIPLSMPAMVSNTSGIGRQENASSNGTVFSQEPHNPNLDHSESGPLVEGHFSEHNGITIQNEVLEHGSEMLEEESRNLNVPPTVDQPPPGLVAPDSGRTWLSAYDGVPTHEDGNANESLPKKPPRPRNPLIDEVVAIDKSKLRKVERSKPQLQSKPEEGESILEQMQLRKVERVKPQADSKMEGGENLLEHLQLRKVGDRVKLSVEQKSEERDFLVEQLQLRKVGERVKPPSDSKSEEKEFLLEQLQLRKVKAKAKEDVDPKVEETESSPLAQLRKVRERVKDEVELKIEDSDSPRLQLRKVTERANPLVTQKPEERDSLFEQIRNKSFNLKPAVAARPNIQGPRTNLKVAAILEKASTIRQAMAGSDEDDDADSWSDES